MSSPDPPAARDTEVRNWMRFAREELRAAEAAARDPEFVPRLARYLAEQAAEKALKAVLVYLDIDPPWIHDLDRLRTLIPDPAAWSITEASLDLAPLTVWATEARYPGEGPEADEADVAVATATARKVVDSVLVDLQRHGFALTPPRRPARRDPSQPELPL
jgi:HEPN domain-containing protein